MEPVRGRRRRTNYVSSSFIPDHLITEILLRTPATSVLKFKSVCKQWCSIIKDPNFIHEHYDHLRKNPSVSFAAYYRGDHIRLEVGHLTTFEDEEKLTVSRVADDKHMITIPQVQPGDGYPHRMVVCNGLLCLYSSYNIHICNPTTKELVTLPVKGKPFREAFGFGYDSVNRHYKVVELLFRSWNPPKEVTLNVYTLGDACRSWRTTSLTANDKDFPCSYVSTVDKRGRHVDGSVYWLVASKKGDQYNNISIYTSILCFDVRDEKFKPIKLPDGLEFLKDFKQISMLVAFKLHRFGIAKLDHERNTMDIWMITKEVSSQDLWTKVFTIDVSAISRDYFYYSFYYSSCYLTVKLMREKFLLMTPKGLVSYDVQNNKIEQVLENSKDLIRVDVYMQTMISVHDMAL